MSNNLQKIIEYAKDTSCVACITPHFGGAWHSSIRTGEGPQPTLPPVAGDSIAQRLGLLTKYNCDTSNLDFRLGSTAQNNWYVKTGLSFAGWSRPLTIIGRMYVAPDSGGSEQYDYDTNIYHPLIQQGHVQHGRSVDFTLGVFYINQNNANVYRVTLSYGSTFSIFNATPPSIPHGRIVTLAITIDPLTGRISVYEDGILLNSVINASLIGFTLSTDTSSTYNDPVAYIHQRLNAWQNRNDYIFWCMIFDRVLNDAEIKFLST